MKSQHIRYAWLASACLGLGDPAFALAIAGPDGTRAQGSSMVQDAPAGIASAVPTLELSRGQIESLHPGRSVVGIAGRQVEFDPDKLRVVGADGRMERGVGALRKGMNVRFALEPKLTAIERRIVLIYIDP